MSEREKERVRIPGPRCPYCHEDIEASGLDKLACNACMAWHHKACWEEHGHCAACSHRETGLGSSAATERSVAKPVEKPAPCHYTNCEEFSAHNDLWRVGRRVCPAHNKRETLRFLAVFFVGYLALASIVALAWSMGAIRPG
jgi:hypothetical protein